METSNPKSVLVDAIKKSTNILVTVSHNPSVDALAAALGFSLMLNKLDKHSTAVFSGAIPPAIQFLDPQKTFENSVSSLRDFIIALDKEKADRLRYKVEGDVVRIYITPYKTTITQDDLDFSEGDFNVDLVIALGVEKQSDLDDAISAHGRILHDATVATVNLSTVKSSLGTIDWSDDKASSLCEMLMSLSEALQSNLLDEQIATALLTGIVAATDRFSNKHTTPRVMTMSAQLMAAGANQQLIAEKLEEGGEALVTETAPSKDGTTPLTEDISTSVKPKKSAKDGEMQVHHDQVLDKAVADAEHLAEEATEDRQEAANAKLEAALARSNTAPVRSLADDLREATKQETGKDWRENARVEQEIDESNEPTFGGTLNASASEAEEAKRAEERSNRNHTLLSHDNGPDASNDVAATMKEPDDVDPFAVSAATVTGDSFSKGKTLQPVTMQPIKSSEAPLTPPVTPEDGRFTPFPVASPTPKPEPSASTLPPLPPDVTSPALPSSPVPTPANPVPAPNDLGLSYEEAPLPKSEYEPAFSTDNKTLADLEAEVHAAASASPATSSIDDARAAVTSAFETQPLSVGGQTTVPEPAHTADVEQVPIPDGPFSPPPLPPMPDFSSLPPLPPMPGEAPGMPTAPHPGAIPQPAQTPPVTPAPGQFQIPGQQ